MATTRAKRSDEPPVEPVRAKRFVSTQHEAPASPASVLTPEAPEVETGPLMSPRAAISGVVMGAAALLCFFIGAGFSGPGNVSKATAQQVSTLREQIKAVETKDEALPSAKDADRGLTDAQISADQVARFQNDYRSLTPAVAAAGGTIDDAKASGIRRNLVPYFAPTVDQASMQPWYLLAADKDVKPGASVPMSFRSGFEWVAQRPYLISENSNIEVTWLAMQNFGPEDQPRAVLAWVRADFELRTKTFSNLRSGTTTTGEALRQEVKQ